MVTASIDRLDFHHPVFIGDLLFFKASLNFVGRTSMELGVRVEAENLLTGEVLHTASAYLTYVALDKDGRLGRSRRSSSKRTKKSGGTVRQL